MVSRAGVFPAAATQAICQANMMLQGHIDQFLERSPNGFAAKMINMPTKGCPGLQLYCQLGK